jgi:Zn-dependent protease with chaperone function
MRRFVMIATLALMNFFGDCLLAQKSSKIGEPGATPGFQTKKGCEGNAEPRFQKIKDYADNQYRVDADFRDRVEARYEDLLREHLTIAAASRNASFYAPPQPGKLPVISDQLYRNSLVQDMVNEFGQNLTVQPAQGAFVFRAISNPLPQVKTLSAGSIYLSTGLALVLQNESQLAFVLAHEMAHVKLGHWKETGSWSSASSVSHAPR